MNTLEQLCGVLSGCIVLPLWNAHVYSVFVVDRIDDGAVCACNTDFNRQKPERKKRKSKI